MALVNCLARGALVAGIAFTPVASQAQPSVAPEAVTSSPLDRWQPLIAEASHHYGIPEAWIRAVMRAESGGLTMLNGQPITSRAGAMGLMQIMPDTWADLRERYGFGDNPYDPRDNIMAGTAYLRELYVRYGYPNLFAAYNAGPGRFDAYLFGGQPLPGETLAYLAALGQPGFERPRPPLSPSATGLFFALNPAADSASDTSTSLPSGGLFVPLNTGPEQKP